jgi:hypothetical protein
MLAGMLLVLGALLTATVGAGSARSETLVPDPVAIDVDEAISASDGPSALPSESAASDETISVLDAVSVLLAQVAVEVSEHVTVADNVSVVQAQVPVAVAEGVTVADAVSVQPQVPTAVTLRSFSAHRTRPGVLLRWRTASEIDLLGFDVYRLSGGHVLKLNRRLIAAKAPGRSIGAAYRLLDRRARSGRAYTYRLRALSRTGTRSWSAKAITRAGEGALKPRSRVIQGAVKGRP